MLTDTTRRIIGALFCLLLFVTVVIQCSTSPSADVPITPQTTISYTYTPPTTTTTTQYRPEWEYMTTYACGTQYLSSEIAYALHTFGQAYDIPVNLLVAVAYYESGFNPDARNSHDYGLMQIARSNFEDLRLNHNIDARTYFGNIEAAAYYLAQYYNTYNSWTKALLCYNAGPAGAKKMWQRGVTATTYTRNVISKWKELDEYAETYTSKASKN